MLLIQLGRLGDAINVLPLAFLLSRKIGRVDWLVSRDHASLLEGVSYVNPIIWDGAPDTLPAAIRRYQGRPMFVTQAWMNPDTRQLTSSFALEQWRYAGQLEERGKWPVLFDQRNPEREAALVAKHVPKDSKRKLILVATDSISTPYLLANKLIASIRGLNADVIDLRDVRAERFYDLIALYDVADCLVSVDTGHLHLAAASQCPVVALINDGWKGAVPPPQTVASWRYAELGNDLTPVVEATKKQIERKAGSIAVVINTFNPNTERHRRAMATHPADTVYARFDHRPKVKELLAKGLETGKDCLCFTNDDVAFPEGSLDKIRRHTEKFDFGCSRRPRTPVHIGREIFWFKSDWLQKNWNEVPDCYWTVQKPDLILAKWMRGLRGIQTTMENLNYDFPPIELPAGLITHDEHPSHWDCDEVTLSVEGRHNDAIWAAML